MTAALCRQTRPGVFCVLTCDRRSLPSDTARCVLCSDVWPPRSALRLFIDRTTKEPKPQPPDRPSLVWSHEPNDNGSEGNNLKITWLPNTQGRPGSHFFVQYRRHGESRFQSTPSEYYQDSIVLRGLDPGMVYEIRTVSVDGEYYQHSDIEEVGTTRTVSYCGASTRAWCMRSAPSPWMASTTSTRT